ncbi:MAG: hypothetical protein K2K20_05805, partial [Lachnospiraceae bacterium]|nr:hypothetical protein [Lachnospiraceae bacterium]
MEDAEWENFIYVVKETIGIKQIFYIDGVERAAITTNTLEVFDRNRIIYYQNNADEILGLLPYYVDEESFKVMNEYIRTYSEKDVYRNMEIATQYKYFYDKEKEEIYSHLDDEVWLNFGANTGDSVFSFFRNGLRAKAIYAIEAEKETYARLVDNLKLLPDDMRKSVIAKNIFVDENTDINELMDDEIVTLINADIEGSELSMLKLLADKIKRDKPVLAICLYHQKEDLVEIPRYIRELYDGYKFILRKYLFTWCNGDRNTELVLYAIPENRMIGENKDR